MDNQMEIYADDEKKILLKKMKEISLDHLDFIQEDMAKIKFFYIFYDRLQEMANIFADKNQKLMKKYNEIITYNENKIKKEILVQDKFLEYNDNIDNLIKNLDKNILNADNFIEGEFKFKFKILKFFKKRKKCP